LESQPPVLVLARDLIMGSRITATARAVDVEVVVIREPSKLAMVHPGQLWLSLIVDLNEPGAFDAADDWRLVSPYRHVYGFVAHVDAEILRRARERFDRVLPRSAFVEQLETVLRDARDAARRDKPCEGV
jgi:hypothetical protein